MALSQQLGGYALVCLLGIAVGIAFAVRETHRALSDAMGGAVEALTGQRARRRPSHPADEEKADQARLSAEFQPSTTSCTTIDVTRCMGLYIDTAGIAWSTQAQEKSYATSASSRARNQSKKQMVMDLLGAQEAALQRSDADQAAGAIMASEFDRQAMQCSSFASRSRLRRSRAVDAARSDTCAARGGR